MEQKIDAIVKISEKIIDKTHEVVPTYLVALSIVAGVNILATSQFLVGHGIPTFFGVAFVIAPLYLLLIPYICVLRIFRWRRRFYLLYTAFLLEEDGTEKLLEGTKTCVSKIQSWWLNSIGALVLYMSLSFILLTLQVWIVS